MPMRPRLPLALAFVLGACSAQPAVQPAPAPAGVPAASDPAVLHAAHHAYRVVTVAEGLVNPWSMAWLPNGDMLVTERPGRLRIVRNGRLLPDPVAGLPAIRGGGQGGLLDVVAHPQFAGNRLVYIAYSKPSPDTLQGATAVARARFENDRLVGLEDIIVTKTWSRGRGHHGARLVFDGRGHLFVSLGDRQVAPEGDLTAHPAQDLMNHFGKILRLNEDGSVPADNPFQGRSTATPEIWSYGHRNVQGMTIHPGTGALLATEHGPQGGDELNVILPGRNYGWPVVGFGVNYRTGSAIHAGTHREGMEQPAHIWVPSIGTSGLIVYTGDRFPGWKGSVLAGGLVGEQLGRLTMDGNRVTNVELLAQRIGRIRDVRQGPDGFIYLAIEHRQGQPTPIVRLEPAR